MCDESDGDKKFKLPEDQDSRLDALEMSVPRADIYIKDGKLRIWDMRSKQLLEIPFENLIPFGRIIPKAVWEEE